MRTVWKIRITMTLLIGIVTIVNVQANSACDDAYSAQNVTPSNITFHSDKRYPQTILHKVVSDFLKDDNITKEKKVLMLGYDGFREDTLQKVFPLKQSAVHHIAREGGLYHSYAGADGNQTTDTAPGWLSILSGEWAYKHGVYDNKGSAKGVSTFLKEAANMGFASTFIASWAPHFTLTYKDELNKNVRYQQMDDDMQTLTTLHATLSNTSNTSYDVIFATLEFSDHAGHSEGYGNDVEAYVGASQHLDQEAYAILETIYQRETYKDEEWLIVLTSDHGGINKYHGGQSADEKNTWFAVNKEINIE